MSSTTYIHGGMKDSGVYIDLDARVNVVSVLEVQIVEELARCYFDGKIESGSFFGRDKTENGFTVKKRVEQSDGWASYDTVCFVWGKVESGILTEVYGRISDITGTSLIVEAVNFCELWKKMISVRACDKI